MEPVQPPRESEGQLEGDQGVDHGVPVVVAARNCLTVLVEGVGREGPCFLLFLVVFLFGVHVPHVVLSGLAGKDVFYRLEGSAHAVVDVVIAMLAVAPHAEQVGDRIQERP